MTLQISKKQIIGLATGVYDVLHVGHLTFLQSAKAQCDKLVVGINTDSIVKKHKGEGRPVNTEENRKKMLEALRYVDDVFIFDVWEIEPVMANVKPDIYFITDGDPGEEVKIQVAKKYKAKLVKLPSYNNKLVQEAKKVRLPTCPFYFTYFKNTQKAKYAFAKMSATDIIQKLESLGH